MVSVMRAIGGDNYNNLAPSHHQQPSYNQSHQRYHSESGRPLSYNEPRQPIQHNQEEYPFSDTEYHMTHSRDDRHMGSLPSIATLPPPVPPPIRKGAKDSRLAVKRRKAPEPQPIDLDVLYRRSYAGRERDMSPIAQLRHSYAGRSVSSLDISSDDHSRGHSFTDNELLAFALNANVPLPGSRPSSRAASRPVSRGPGSQRNSIAVSIGGSKRNSYVSTGGSKRNSLAASSGRRSRGISFSEGELDTMISQMDPYNDEYTSDMGSKRGSLATSSHSRSASQDTSNEMSRFFIQPMNLCEPEEDILGYTQVHYNDSRLMKIIIIHWIIIQCIPRLNQ